MMDLTDKRDATPEDIIVGNKVYYPDSNFSCVIEDVLHPHDPYKAFTAHDGCRYGLDGAYVEITKENKPQVSENSIISIKGGVIAFLNQKAYQSFLDSNPGEYVEINEWSYVVNEPYLSPVHNNTKLKSKYPERTIESARNVFNVLELPYKIICSTIPNTPCFIVGIKSELVIFIGSAKEM